MGSSCSVVRCPSEHHIILRPPVLCAAVLAGTGVHHALSADITHGCRCQDLVDLQPITWSRAWPCIAVQVATAAPCARLLVQGHALCASHMLGLASSSHRRHTVHCTCAGCVDGRFQVFETLTWRAQTWSHRHSGFLVDAVWSATTSPAALILVCSRQFFSLHFTEPAPALHAQFVPLHAPQVFDAEVSSGTSAARCESPRGVRTSRRFYW